MRTIKLSLVPATNFVFSPTYEHQFACQKCFDDLIIKYPEHRLQELVIFFLQLTDLSPEAIEKIIADLLICSKKDYFSISDNYITVDRKTLLWKTKDGIHSGHEILSLIQFFKGGSELDTIEYVKELLNLNINNIDIQNCKKYHDYMFVEHQHVYQSIIINLPPTPVIDHILIGQYTFHSENGCPLFILQEYLINEEHVRIFITVQADETTGQMSYQFIPPPNKYMIFNRHLIDRNENCQIYIYDQISQTNTWFPVHGISTWAGDLLFSSQLDWSFLKGRTVSYIFDPDNLESMIVGHQLIKKFEKMNTILQLRPTSSRVNISSKNGNGYSSEMISIS